MDRDIGSFEMVVGVGFWASVAASGSASLDTVTCGPQKGYIELDWRMDSGGTRTETGKVWDDNRPERFPNGMSGQIDVVAFREDFERFLGA
jgi:hypothetical protein